MSINPFFPPRPIPDTPQNSDRCQCPKCPTSPGQPSFFCARGDPSKAISKKDCLCHQCAIFQEFKLNIYFDEAYFCETGKIA